MENVVGNEAVITGSLAVGLLVLRQAAVLVGKIIPDDADGPLGLVRKLCKFIGIYVVNRKSRNDPLV